MNTISLKKMKTISNSKLNESCKKPNKALKKCDHFDGIKEINCIRIQKKIDENIQIKNKEIEINESVPYCLTTQSISYENGDRYEGEVNDKFLRHGYGIYYYKNGDFFEGDYVNNKKEGLGVYKFISGDKYIGGFKDNKKHGEGEYFFAKKEVNFCGIWENGKVIKRID